MKKRFSIASCIVIVFLFCAATFLITAVAFQTQRDSRLDELQDKADFYDKLFDVYNRVNDSFLKETEKKDLEYTYLSAYINSLDDPYSVYLTEEEMKAYLADSEGNMVGIGVHAAYDSESEGIYITGVMPDSPAFRAGMQTGDIIVQVEDIIVSQDSYYTAINAVKGAEGEPVSLVVKRDGKLFGLEIVRAAIESESVIFEKIDNEGGHIAYISIIEFDGHTAEMFENALKRAEEEGCDRYIFDVRNNPGGDLNAIVSVLDLLLPEGPIINIVDKNGKVTSEESDKDFLDAPMVVLINGYTASAAELFTAALRDYELAEIVGTTTFGKGTMQTVTTLPDGSGLKLSTYYYNPPYGDNYHGVGVSPDVETIMPKELMERFYLLTNEEDNQLQKAIEIIIDK